MSRLKLALVLISLALTAAAVVQELKQPKSKRTWQGRIVGIPYDFRVPSLGRLAAAWWKPGDKRLFLPRAFGLGWDVNIPRLIALLQGGSTEAEIGKDDEGEKAARPSLDGLYNLVGRKKAV